MILQSTSSPPLSFGNIFIISPPLFSGHSFIVVFFILALSLLVVKPPCLTWFWTAHKRSVLQHPSGIPLAPF